MAWIVRHITAIREIGLGTFAIGFLTAALGFGGDMTLIALALLLGWVMGSIALVTAPALSETWKAIAVVLFSLFCAGEGTFLYWHFHGNPFSEKTQLVSLDELFEQDFKEMTQMGPLDPILVGIGFEKYPLKARIYFDMDGESYFLGFLIPHSDKSAFICQQLATQYMFEFNDFRKHSGGGWVLSPGDSVQTDLDQFTFTRRVYIYHEDALSLKQQSDLTDLFEKNGAHLTLRGPAYLFARQQQR